MYDTEDMPGRWNSVFEEVEENFSRSRRVTARYDQSPYWSPEEDLLSATGCFYQYL